MEGLGKGSYLPGHADDGSAACLREGKKSCIFKEKFPVQTLFGTAA